MKGIARIRAIAVPAGVDDALPADIHIRDVRTAAVDDERVQRGIDAVPGQCIGALVNDHDVRECSRRDRAERHAQRIAARRRGVRVKRCAKTVRIRKTRTAFEAKPLTVFQQSQFLEGIDAAVAVGTDGKIAAPFTKLHGVEQAIAEVGLGDRADHDTRAVAGDALDFLCIRVCCMHELPARTKINGVRQQSHRCARVRRNAFLQLTALLRDMDVNRKVIAEQRFRTADEIAQPRGGHGAQRMRRDAGCMRHEAFQQHEIFVDVPVHESRLPGRRRAFAEAGMKVRDRQQPQSDAGLLGRGNDGVGHRARARTVRQVMQVMEFRNAREAGAQHVDEALARDGMQVIRRDPRGETVHRLAPGPEGIFLRYARLAVTCERALEDVAVRIGHARQRKPAVPVARVRRRGFHAFDPPVRADNHLPIVYHAVRRQQVAEFQDSGHVLLVIRPGRLVWCPFHAPKDRGITVFDLVIHNARVHSFRDGIGADAHSVGITDGRIAALDPPANAAATRRVDADGRVLMPGFIDCHTHAVFAGDRMQEHAMKLAGASYEEIARAGGGIVSTVAAVREADVERLVAESLPRVAALAAEGVTTLEIKSGYGLDTELELRLLRAIRTLRDRTDIDIVATFLGAHTVPKGRSKDEYLDEVIDQMLPRIAQEHLADAVDIFVERIAFDAGDLRRLFARARELGLELKAHTDQLSNMNGTRIAAELHALSCDHLEHSAEDDIRAMAKHGTVAVLLPGAFYFIRETKKPPVDLLRKHKVPIAVATDLNPGTSPVASILAAMHMSCIFFGLTAEEALRGATVNGARALGLGDRGVLEAGRRADFTLWDIPAPEFLVYQLGGLAPAAIYIQGIEQ